MLILLLTLAVCSISGLPCFVQFTCCTVGHLHTLGCGSSDIRILETLNNLMLHAVCHCYHLRISRKDIESVLCLQVQAIGYKHW